MSLFQDIHTSRQSAERDGVTFINPGSAGPRRFKLPVTVGYLDITTGAAGPDRRDFVSESVVPAGGGAGLLPPENGGGRFRP